jgi:uncharacterized protein (DUF1330 family)
MPAYIIYRAAVTDWDKYREYMKHTPRIIAEYGGRFIVRGGASVTLEGPPGDERVVVLEFPTLEQAKLFYDSPEYTKARAIRADAGEARMFAVEAYPDADWQSVLAASRLESF